MKKRFVLFALLAAFFAVSHAQFVDRGGVEDWEIDERFSKLGAL